MRILTVDSALAVLFLVACGETAPVTTLATADQFGQVQLSVVIAPEVARVRLTVTATDMDPVNQDCAAVEARVSCSLTIKAGQARRFEATAYNQVAMALFSGAATADVPANTVTELTITLQSVEQGAPSGQVNIGANFNRPPQVRIGINPNPSRRNGDVSIWVVASDPDGDPLTYQWTASGGTLTGTVTANVTWRTPNTSGDYDVRAVVRDNQGGETPASVIAIVR